MRHEVWIPSLHRDLSDGQEVVEVEGATVGEVIERLDERFPGLRDRLCQEDRLRPNIAVAVNGTMSHRGLRQRLPKPSEIHFIPALSGG